MNFVKFLRTPISIEHHWWLLLKVKQHWKKAELEKRVVYKKERVHIFDKITNAETHQELFLRKASSWILDWVLGASLGS